MFLWKEILPIIQNRVQTNWDFGKILAHEPM